MALARKPKPQTKTEAPKDERAIEALISKGGSVAETAAKDKERLAGEQATAR